MLEELGPVQVVAERLATLYPDAGSLRRLLALAKVEAARIPFDGRASNMGWFAAVEAARQGRLRRLVEVMLEEYALDPWLVMVYVGLVKMRNGGLYYERQHVRRDRGERWRYWQIIAAMWAICWQRRWMLRPGLRRCWMRHCAAGWGS